MSNAAIVVEHLSKSYRLGLRERQHQSFRDALTGMVTGPLRRLREMGERGTQEDTFWALKDVNFEVKQGEVVGIIGRNGAGKSTLLKVLSRIVEPTSGRVRMRGRVASLLEVGTGFHPELSGRENIYMNGSILGMRKAEIDRKFDEIVAFAEVERFLDTPVKRYSSGMYVRLAFAVAASLEPEILIVDEVLAVGDAEFQKKCLGKMKEVSQGGGRTVLFVSHNLAAVANLCSKGVVLGEGKVKCDEQVDAAVKYYLDNAKQMGVENGDSLDPLRAKWAQPLITNVRVFDNIGTIRSEFAIGEDICVEMTFELGSIGKLKAPVMGIVIRDQMEMPVAAVNMRMTGHVREIDDYGRCVMTCKLRDPLFAPGDYIMDLWLGDGQKDVDMIAGGAKFSIATTDYYNTGTPPFGHLGAMILNSEWDVSTQR